MTLEIEGIRFSYGDREILKGIDLSFDPGTTAILGPNGAGKSTLVKCLAGVHRPSAGSATFNGTSLLDGGRAGVRMSYMSQEMPQISNMTVLEVMLLGMADELSIRVRERQIDRAYGALETMNIGDLAAKRLDELSGGQCQMVMIAQCLVSDPDLILLDEPMNNLDLRRELEMFESVGRLTRERGMTTVMVLHDINFASRFSDRLAVLSDGEIYGTGTPAEIVTEDMLRDVYGVEAIVGRDSGGNPMIEPLRSTMMRVRGGAPADV